MVKEPLEITVGGAGPYDPVAGASDCLIPVLRGRTLLIEKRGVGPLLKSEFTPLTSGGFRLGGRSLGIFQAGEIYFVYDTGVEVFQGEASFTNGFNYPAVAAAFFGRLGWRGSTNAGALVPSANNATSRSGRYFEDFHALCTLGTVKSVQDDPKATDDQINEELEAWQMGAILRALNGVLNEPEYLEHGLDFVRDDERTDRLIQPSDLFVYRRITPARDPMVAIQIDSVSLYFDQDVTFPIYLFQEGHRAPLLSMEVTAIGQEKTIVKPQDWILSFVGSGNLGGAYYLGYFQADLGAAKAYHETNLSSFIPGLRWNLEGMEAKRTGAQAFDRTIRTGSAWTHGLGLEITAFQDWTPLIIKKASVFDELVGLVMASIVLEKAINAQRSNPTERAIKDGAMPTAIMELTGAFPAPEGPRVTGLRQRIDRELQRVKRSIFPRPRGINYSTEETGGWPC